MANEIGDAFVEAMPAIGTPGPTYATEIEEVIAELQERLESPVALTSLASQADNTVLARLGAGSSGAPSAVTVTALAAAMPTFAVGVTGMVTGPASGPTGKFLRDDHTWQPATVDLSGYLTTAAAAATYASYAYIAGQSYATTGDLALYATSSDLTTGLAGKADKTITISSGTGLTGGGDLSANRTVGLADIATKTVLANLTGGSAAPTANTMADLAADLPLATTSAKGVVQLSGVSGEVLTGTGWATGGGGGLSATDLPDNIATSFDGRDRLEIEPVSGDLSSVVASEKFAIQVNGHQLQIKSTGAPTPTIYTMMLDPLRHKTHLWYVSNATTVAVVIGGISANVAGTITNVWPTAGADFVNLAVTYLAIRNRTSAGANSYAGWWGTTFAACTANSARTKGGFIFRARVSPAFATVHTTSRMFFGLYPNDPRAANIDYGATAHHVGFCLDPGDTNLCFSIRGSAARQKVSLGANFPGNLVDSTVSNNTYILSVYNPRQFPDLFFVTAECEETGNTFSQVITASAFEKPDPDKGLYKILYCNNSTIALEPGFRFIASQLITGV